MNVTDQELPPGWCWTDLGSLGRYLNGRGFKKAEWAEEGRPIIRIQNLTGSSTQFNYFEGEVDQKHEVQSGDLLMSWAATLGAYVWRGPRSVLNQHIFKVESFIDQDFHYYALRWALEELYRNAHGTGMVHVTKKKFDSNPVLLPPTNEQHRIVEAIESYFTRLDDAVATLERVQRNLKRYRASVLKAAVEGRLVPTEAELARAEGRDYEPASVLLERILAERRRRWEEVELAKMKAKGKVPKDDKWKAKYKEPFEPEAAALPALPEGWLWVSLNQLFETITDGDHQPPPQSPDGIPFLVISNVKSGSVDFHATRFVPQNYYDSLDDPRKPRSGDLLYTVTGSYGIPVRVGDDTPFCVQRHIAILRPTAQSNSDFLYYVLQSQPVVEQASRTATGTAQKTVGLKQLRDFVVPLPPGAEQSRIVAALEGEFSLADNSVSVVRRSAQRCGRLRQAILKWAFEGKLVDQDPNDEPASVLLKRIRAEREAAGGQKKKRRATGRRKSRAREA